MTQEAPWSRIILAFVWTTAHLCIPNCRLLILWTMLRSHRGLLVPMNKANGILWNWKGGVPFSSFRYNERVTNKVVVVVVVVVVASIHYYSTETDITHMDNFLLLPPIFWKVVRWGSGSFEYYLLVCVILLECHSIRGPSRDVTQ